MTDSQSYSQRLGAISPAQFEAACLRLELGAFRAASVVAGGLFGQNVFIETSKGSFVFRGAPHADWQLPLERYFSTLVSQHDPGLAPAPYLLCEDLDIFGSPFAVVPRLVGDSAEHLFGGNHRAMADPAFARAAGDALGRLHAIPVDHAGLFDLASDAVLPLPESYASYLGRRIHAVLSSSRAASPATTDADVEWVASLLAAAGPSLDLPFEPAVVHLDFSPGNIVGIRTDGEFVVTGIVDWMTAEAGDPEADFPRLHSLCLEHPERALPFFEAYTQRLPLRPGWHERFAVHMLLDRLLLWEYGQRNSVWFTPDQTLRSWAEPYVCMPLRE